MSLLASMEMEEIFNSIDSANTTSNDYHRFFALAIQNFPDEDKQKAILSRINKLLTTSTSREKGLKCLNVLVFWCPPPTLQDYAIKWVSQAIGHNDRANMSTEAVKFLGNIIPLCSDFQDFNKALMSSYLTKILEVCISFKANSVQTESALLCLEACLVAYPSTCIPMKNKMESYVLKFLHEKLPENVVKKAGRCYHFLQQVGGAGPDGINHIKNWSNTLQKLCNTIHVLYDKFFEDVMEIDTYEILSVSPLDLPDYPSDSSSVEVLTLVENRLKNHGAFVRTLLQTKYPVAKVVTPKLVLDVVKRSLSIHMCTSNNCSSEGSVEFNILLMKHQVDALYLLRSCMAALGSNVIPFSALVTKMLLDYLSRTAKCDCFINNGIYKESVYKVLTFWINLVKNNLSVSVHEPLLLIIIDDIAPIKSEVSLTLTPQKNSGAKKNAVNKSATKQLSAKGHSKNSLEIKEKISQQALNCLISLLKNIYISVKPNTLKILYATITETISSLQSGRITFPYCDVKSEEKLYETLLALIQNSNDVTSPPLDTASYLFVNGQKNSNHSVAQTCALGLNCLQTICQPICPTLNLMDIEDETMREDRRVENDTADTNGCVEDDGNNDESERETNDIQNDRLENGYAAQIDTNEVPSNQGDTGDTFTVYEINVKSEMFTPHNSFNAIASASTLHESASNNAEVNLCNKAEVIAPHFSFDTSSSQEVRIELEELIFKIGTDSVLDEGVPVESQAKKVKFNDSATAIEADEENNEMMNSFVDVVNDY